MITLREEKSVTYGIRLTYICTFCSTELAFSGKESPICCYVCDKKLPDMHMLMKNTQYKQQYHFNTEEA